MENEKQLAIVQNQLVSHEEMDQMATYVAASGMVGTTNKSAVLTLMLLCQSEGLHPVKALLKYDIIENKPAMKASALVAEFGARGHHILIHIRDKDECSATFFTTKPDDKMIERAKKRYKLMTAGEDKRDNSAISDLQYPGEVTIIRTMIEAIASKLAMGKDGIKLNWLKSPAQMLYARCMSEGVNVIDPGIKAGMSTPEEMLDVALDRVELLGNEAAQHDAEIVAQENERAIAAGGKPGDGEPFVPAKKEKKPKAPPAALESTPATSTHTEEKTQPSEPVAQQEQTPGNVVEGEFVLQEEAPEELDFAGYEIAHVKSSAYKGKELATFTKEEIDVLYAKRSLPYANSEDPGLKLEAEMIAACKKEWDSK